jgi:hypothetical protein
MRRSVEAAWRRAIDGDPRVCWALAALVALVFGHGLLADVDKLGLGDWDYFTAQSVVARRAWLEYGQAPFWSPYHCGGVAITENFQSRAWSPSLLFVLGLGAFWGNRLWMLFSLAVGFEGARRLARAIGAGPWGAWFVAFAVAGNGAVAARMAIGHFGDLPYLFLPWWLLAIDRCHRDPVKGALASGAWGALMYLEGGIYALIYGALIAFAITIARSRSERSLRPLLGLGLALVSTAGLAMHVLLPSTLFGLDTLQRELLPETFPLGALREALFSTDLVRSGLVFHAQRWRWHEYAAYVGPVLPLAIGLACLRGSPRTWGWLLLALFFVSYALGDFAKAAPWTISHHLPLLRSLRASGRALIPAILCASLAVSTAIDRWRAAPLLAGALAISLALVTPAALHHAFTIAVPAIEPDPVFTQRLEQRHYQLLFRSNYSLMTLDALHNRGSLSCYEPLPPHPGARVLWPEHGEVVLMGTRGSARIVAWSPNRLRIALAGITVPGELLVNQNYHRGWSAVDRRPIRDHFGVIALPVQPQDRVIELNFQPPAFYQGLGVSILSLLLLCWPHVRGRHSRQPA